MSRVHKAKGLNSYNRLLWNGRIISDRSAKEDIKISNEGRAREIVTKILSLKLLKKVVSIECLIIN